MCLPYPNPASKSDYARNWSLQDSYGITLADYYRLCAEQCGACAICGTVPSENIDGGRNQKVLHVDHDHKTGAYRGLLCSNCNRCLGMFRDCPVILRRAADYLEGGLPGMSLFNLGRVVSASETRGGQVGGGTYNPLAV
jgi:ribosomal protein L34E